MYYHLVNVLQLTVTGFFITSAVFFLTSRLDPVRRSEPVGFDWDLATISLVVSMIGTILTVLFRWRADVRNSRRVEVRAHEMDQRLQNLEFEVESLKSKLT